MAKLWDKGYKLNSVVEDFMTSDDPVLDLRIIKYDCIASIAHAKMLFSIGILSKDESILLENTLHELILQIEVGQFTISYEDEDMHTAIENYLTVKLGDVGKKIHTGRSRNDQVLVALRLYSKDEIKNVITKTINVMEVMSLFADKFANIPYVGRTHYQKAMPSSFGLWIGSYIESLLDDCKILINAYEIIDQSPLGSAASYGVNLSIDRQLTSDLLGFAKVQNNVLYANNSRGKFESIIIHALSQIMLDLAKLATDVILFSAPEMGYLILPEEFCPGSSIMPNKKNPDPFELIRAKSSRVLARLWQTIEVIKALPSGYNRDFQETKAPLFDSFDTVLQSLEVVAIIFAKVNVDEEKCLNSFSPEVFATDYALDLVKNGTPFRDAYKKAALNLSALPNLDPVKNILAKTHLGATGNLGLAELNNKIEDLKKLYLLKGE